MASVGHCYQFSSFGTCTYGDGCRFQHVTKDLGKKGSKNRKSGKKQVMGTSTHIAGFFARYPAFQYDPTEAVTDEFYRMCDQFNWDKDDHRKIRAKSLFNDALVHDFNGVYGTDEKDIDSWHVLCHVLDITPLPEGLHACREYLKAVNSTHVNLVDLVDLQNSGRQIEIFSSEQELSEYTKNTGKFFPKENAYAGGLLKYLLRHIINPQIVSRTNKRRRRR